MWEAETAWRDVLQGATIGDLVDELDGTVAPEQLDKAVDWFRGVLR
jgi:hypothetical protein